MKTEKFKELVHYIVHECRDDPARLGAIRLNKAVWWTDVAAFKECGKTVTDDKYVKRGILPGKRQWLDGRTEMDKVNVLYKYVDGAHFFVSDDEKTLGLCVANKDPIKAFEAVSIQLTKLFKENHGEDAIFAPSLNVVTFQKWFVGLSEEALSGPMPGAAGVFPWEQVVT